ncbi:sugar phosphate isomerase/epimerase [Parabacteroides sp. PF5-9]|uniref:sugar phosphate isomerase/epimerase family protein n=1 Tax=Parabacteroides sp. PF5-9 TaxID=1742404 RepID=UPI0024735C49|nr:sugar phosphate isomerase/epimerase [Parabacteroides sp. PF5-9]MDH6356938.1 sugar phosphate isomerase/epimerase [Parabacteroides sp. PF5-9]
MTNRRDFLRNASLFTLGGLLAGKGSMASAATNAAPVVHNVHASKNFGLQIYSLFRELYDDVPGGLKKVADMGYSYIELAGYRDGKISNIEMADFKKMADDAGLKIRSTHVNPPVREYNASNKQQIMDFWKKAADDHAKIGVQLLIQPGQPSTRSVEETAYVGEIFNEAGKIAKAAGLSFGYHNHEMEFAQVIPGGSESKFGRRAYGRDQQGVEIIYDLMLKNTDPSLVFFELDVYWTVMGQQDPVAYIKKYKDRIKALHIKDKYVLGQSGMMNFERIFAQANANGITNFFVELERMAEGTGTQFEGVKGCADFLNKSSFVK